MSIIQQKMRTSQGPYDTVNVFSSNQNVITQKARNQHPKNGPVTALIPILSHGVELSSTGYDVDYYFRVSGPDPHPRTWEAQFQSGIKTIALTAVREGVVQLGSVHKRTKFNYIESIPGVLLPHPSSSSSSSSKINGYGEVESWHFQGTNLPHPMEFSHDHFNQQIRVTPSMSSLEALLSKLPAVVPPPMLPVSAAYCEAAQPPPQYLSPPNRHLEQMVMERVTKEERDDEKDDYMGESSSSNMSSYPRNPNFNYLHHHDQWISKSDH
ncbi:hypothetical protein Vadar_004096 [Vaccinium darrowii]|uniref:Uncharacterized protein n=1 Tax=Vaccinium darrowii TaxID=229202 RepID=A0ACB7WXH6_9ERIC|nr:hypothetical protein Vadar_004096 [Vaccinium darrowii]